MPDQMTHAFFFVHSVSSVVPLFFGSNASPDNLD